MTRARWYRIAARAAVAGFFLFEAAALVAGFWALLVLLGAFGSSAR